MTFRRYTTGTLRHDDVIKWKHFPRYWPFERGIHRPPANSPHKGHWRRALVFSVICAWINGWVSTREAGDLRRQRAHYDVVQLTWDKNKLSLTKKCFKSDLNNCCKTSFKRKVSKHQSKNISYTPVTDVNIDLLEYWVTQFVIYTYQIWRRKSSIQIIIYIDDLSINQLTKRRKQVRMDFATAFSNDRND